MGNNVKTKPDLSAVAASCGDNALQRKAEELRDLVQNDGLKTAPNDDQYLALNIKNAWAFLYGADTKRWPQKVKDALGSIESGIGLSSFNNGLIAVLQDLRIHEETVPAFEVAQAVVAKLALPDLAEQALQLQDLGVIPDSAARAGLSFVSNPANLVLPIFTAGIAGRAVAGLVTNGGVALQLAGEAVSALSLAISLPSEAAVFMGISSVVAPFMGPDIGPINRATTSSLDASSATIVEEFAASTAFFASLKFFGYVGALAQSLLPLTNVGMTLAKLTGHASSVLGLAATEEIQEKMSGVIGSSVVAPFMGQNVAQNGGPMNRATTFTEKLWRAAFLHGTVQTVYGVVDLKGATSNSEAIIAQAQGYIDTLRANMSLGVVTVTTAGTPYPGPLPKEERQYVSARSGGGAEVARHMLGHELNEIKKHLSRDTIEKEYKNGTSPNSFFRLVMASIRRFETHAFELIGSLNAVDVHDARREMVERALQNRMFIKGAIVPAVPLEDVVANATFGRNFKERVSRFMKELAELCKPEEIDGNAMYDLATGVGPYLSPRDKTKIKLPHVDDGIVFGPIHDHEWANYKNASPKREAGSRKARTKVIDKDLILSLLKEAAKPKERTPRKEPEGRFYITLKEGVFVEKVREVTNLLLGKMRETGCKFDFKVGRFRGSAIRRDHIVVYFDPKYQKEALQAVQDILDEIGRENLAEEGPHFALPLGKGLSFAQSSLFIDESFNGVVAKKAFKTGWQLIGIYEKAYSTELSPAIYGGRKRHRDSSPAPGKNGGKGGQGR